jgi:glycosyltransferase involved in cell wall biosynthesis
MEIIRRLIHFNIKFTIVTTNFFANECRISRSDVLSFVHTYKCDLIELDSKPFFIGTPPSPIPKPVAYKFLRRVALDHDLIYFNNAYAFHDIIMFITQKLTCKPVISSYHAVLLYGDKMHDWYVSAITRRIALFFQAHHVLNKEDYKLLKSWGANNIYHIPLGVDTNKFKPSPKLHRREKMRILFVGRMTKQKGIDILCSLIHKANRDIDLRKNIEFVVVGAGPLSELIRKLASIYENVLYEGLVHYSRLPDIYSSCDLLIMPSRYETLGVVALEAQSSGLPIIAVEIPALKDIVIQGKTGLLLPRLEVTDLYNGVRTFFNIWRNNFDDFIRIRELCRENIITRFDWDIIANRFVKMFKETVDL